jgi:hypothetical protein
MICEFDPSPTSCASSKDVAEFVEVETGRRDGEVEVLCFSGENLELSGG